MNFEKISQTVSQHSADVHKCIICLPISLSFISCVYAISKMDGFIVLITESVFNGGSFMILLNHFITLNFLELLQKKWN